MLQMAETGVYNEMKKNIFKGAS